MSNVGCVTLISGLSLTLRDRCLPGDRLPPAAADLPSTKESAAKKGNSLKTECLPKAPRRAYAPTTSKIVDQDERDTRMIALLLGCATFIRDAQQADDLETAGEAVKRLSSFLRQNHEDGDFLLEEVKAFAHDIGFNIKAHRMVN